MKACAVDLMMSLYLPRIFWPSALLTAARSCLWVILSGLPARVRASREAVPVRVWDADTYLF